MSESKIKVAIVAPVHNRREITLQCLRSISKLEQTRLDIKTFIVNDGSTDGTSEAIRASFPTVTIIEGDGNLWFTEGTNVGARAALKYDPDYILLINDDQIFDSRSIKAMVDCAEKHPRSVIGPLLLLWDTPHKLFQTAPVWDTWSGGWRHWHNQTVWTIPKKPWKVDIIVGNCVLIPVAAINENGLMNSSRYPNYGDAEYTPRLKKAGWNLIIEPKARVFCQPNSSPKSIRKLGVFTMFSALFVDLKDVRNMRRMLYANLDSAPTKIQGFTAFCLFIFKAIFGGYNEKTSLIKTIIEPPLADTFSLSILDE